MDKSSTKAGLFFFLTLFILLSCSKENHKKEHDLNQRRSKIKEKVVLHSEGLDFFLKKLNSHIDNTKSLSLKNDITLTTDFFQSTLNDFLIANDLPIDGGSIISPDLVNENTIIMSTLDYNIQFSDQFYTLALSIINIQGTNIFEVTNQINTILSTSDFLNLPSLEQDIILIGAETFIDSYAYWDAQAQNWSAISQSNKSLKNQIKLSSWKGVRETAKADGKGAIAGAIAGAIRGAVIGAFFGGGGAGPGALSGAVGGGIQVGVAASILHVWSTDLAPVVVETIEIEDDFVSVDGNLVPEIWTKVAIHDSVQLPSAINYQNGNFIVNF